VSAPTLDLVLDSPIKVRGKTYDRLHLAEPTARMLETAEREFNGETPTIYSLRRYQISLVAVAAGVPRKVVRAMPISHLIEASDFLTAFMAPPKSAQPAKTKQHRKGKRRRREGGAP
jgi:Phage tail assembly chaperone proteins, E, or 41 or 14